MSVHDFLEKQKYFFNVHCQFQWCYIFVKTNLQNGERFYKIREQKTFLKCNFPFCFSLDDNTPWSQKVHPNFEFKLSFKKENYFSDAWNVVSDVHKSDYSFQSQS